MRKKLILLLSVLLLCGVAALLPAQAAERTIQLRDYTNRGFAPDLVQYTVKRAGAERLRVYAPQFTEIPVQIVPSDDPGKALLSFVTALPANGTVTYTVRDDGPGAMPPAKHLTTDGDTQILHNALFAVRMPGTVEKRFNPPVAANTLPAPIIGFCSGNSPWLGSGRMLCTRPVTAFRVKTVADGPVFAEVRYELDFANGGYYHANIRVIDLVPLAKITEEYDQHMLDGTDYWELNLTQGWSPDQMEVASTAGNGEVDHGQTLALRELGATPSPIQSKWVIVPDNAWGPRSQLGLYNQAEQQANPASYPMAGIIPLHKGDWRCMTGVEIWSPDSKQVSLRFPMSVRNASWLKEVTSETSPFSVNTHDPQLPKTYGRRLWGLMLAKASMTCNGESNRPVGPFYQGRLFYGVVGLDRYKDYTLSWPDTGVKYPREFIQQNDLVRYRQTLDQSPLGATLKAKWYVLSGDEKVGKQRADEAVRRLSWLGNFMVTSPTIGHHAMAPNYVIAAAADDALSWVKMSAEQRAEIRARLALVTYLHEEPDVMGYGDGSHTGNPNMGIARLMGMNNFMALLPDHPMFTQWRAHMAAYTAYRVGIMIAPGGGWLEYGGAYQMHAYARVTNALPGLEAAGAPNMDLLYRYHIPDWSYYMNLLTPYDSRWKARIEPGMANSPPSYTEHFLEAAGTLATRDPELAANLKWAWQENGANDRDDPVYGMNGILDRPWLQAKEPKLTSQIYPGVGVIFRAHQGPDETYMFLRSGDHWSHWNEDQGHFILMSKGAVLFPYQPYQYWWTPKKDFDLANIIRFGDPTNMLPHSWPDSNIIDHAFGPTVDFAWSSTGFPDWYNTPGAVEEFKPKTDVPIATGMLRPLAAGIAQQQGAFTWNRQVMFLKGEAAKSPNYFVFRDTMAGDQGTAPGGKLASWMNLNLLGRQQDVKIDGGHVAVDTEWPTKLDLLFVNPGKVTSDFYEENHFVSVGSFSGPSWWKGQAKDPTISRNWVQENGSPVKWPLKMYENPGMKEQHVFLRIPNAPGQEFTWIVYPRGAGEQMPTVTALAPGALKIVTSESTDYVFLSPTYMTYTGEGVTFAGCSGAVRVKQNAVTLTLCSGAGEVGFDGQTLSSATPVERTLSRVSTPKQTVVVAQPKYAISYKPALRGHQRLHDGIRKAAAKADTEYLIDSTTPVTTIDGNVCIEAQHGAIRISPRGIRFICTDHGYARLTVGNVGVRGVGPFDLTFTDTSITGKVDGDTRTLVTTWPNAVVRPMYQMDGVRYYAGWADDHCIVKGTPTPQFAIGFGITNGPHTVTIGEWTYPILPPSPRRATLP